LAGILPSASQANTNVLFTNFGFDSGDLSGWVAAGPVTVDPLGTSPPAALLDEDENLRDGTSLRQAFQFPAGGDTTISFAFGMLVSGEVSDPFPPDAFLVCVLDPQTMLPVSSVSGFSELLAVEFDKLATTFSLDFEPTLVTLEEVTQVALPGIFGVGGTATLRIPTPPGLPTGLLEFRLVGGFDGFHATVIVDCVDASCRCENANCDPGESPCTCPNGCGVPTSTETAGGDCTDGVDNDCDGAADCFDGDCFGDGACSVVCGNGNCSPFESPCNCAADCGAAPLAEITGATCSDGIDNDCDVVSDCNDSDCQTDPTCGLAPDCTAATASPSLLLWSPNHVMAAINVLGVTTSDGAAPSVVVTSIFQDEAVLERGRGAGNTAPDGSGVGTDTAFVRAERNGNTKRPGNGRVYHIGFSATDSRGGSCTGSVGVCVPYDQGPSKAGCVDEGPLYDSTQSR